MKTPMVERLITVKMKPSALRLARMVAAATGDKLYDVFERAMAAEAKRIGVSAPNAPPAIPSKTRRRSEC